MSHAKVQFFIKAPRREELYLVGNTTSLGQWDPEKGVKLDYCQVCNCYVVSKLLPVDETIEFKVVAGKTWDAVERGYFREDVANHTFVVCKGIKVEIEIPNF